MNDDEKFMQRYTEFMGSSCDAQMPVFSRVGRGLRGDSFRIDTYIKDNMFHMKGVETDYSEGEEHEAWDYAVTDICPMIYYRVYKGVREINGDPFWGWYLQMKCSIGAAAFPLWSFTTPFALTEPYDSTDPYPADEIIESNF